MSKVRKRRTNQPDTELPKSLKKYKRTPDKENSKVDIECISPEGDCGFPTLNYNLHEVKTSKGKAFSPKRASRSQKKLGTSLVEYEAEDIRTLNISQLLDLGEGKILQTPIKSDSSETSDSDEEDWEEVKMEESTALNDPVIPKEGVNITLEVPGLNAFKRKKKGFDLEAHIKRQMNQVKRELQVLIHKVHVLCWIAHLKYVNSVLNSETLMGVSLSLISNKSLYPPKYADLGYLERIVKWFHSVIELKEFLKNPLKSEELSEQLCHEFGIKAAYNKKHYVLMMIVLFRTLGLKTRLVMSFQVVHIRPRNIEINGKSKQESEGSKSEAVAIKDVTSKTVEGEVKIIKMENTDFPRMGLNITKLANSEIKDGTCKINKSSNKKKSLRSLHDNVDVSKLTSRSSKGEGKKKVVKRSKSVPKDSDSDKSETSKHFLCSTVTPKKNARKNKETIPCNAAKLPEGKVPIGVTSKIRGKLAASNVRVQLGKEGVVKQSVNKAIRKKSNVTPKTRNKIIEKATQSSDTDSDFMPKSLKKKKKNAGDSKIDRRVFSSDDEEVPMKKKGVDIWAEVFLEAEEKWISVDAIRQKIHCVNELYSRATQPVVYVVACNNDSTLKDVTKRYVPNWHSDTRKRRVDESWWNETMWPYLGLKTAQDKEEDEEINKQFLDKPLPSVIAEYKDHPLYALKRHLLKFEGIYPADAPALGFIRGEPVYARECVVTLRSREVWYKEARVVRLGEEPYKIVKARPKYDKMSGEVKKGLPLELFGFWQTEEFIPPVATDGKVPRNEYGNVDLFKPCMLPKGTVHLQIPSLNKVAKKLGVDCAAAVVGFEFHSGASHPLTDGFVVCEEFKDVLLDAWNKVSVPSVKCMQEEWYGAVSPNWYSLHASFLSNGNIQKMKITPDGYYLSPSCLCKGKVLVVVFLTGNEMRKANVDIKKLDNEF